MTVGQEMYHKTYHGRVIVLGEPNASGLVMVADADDREHEFYTKVEKLRERKARVPRAQTGRPPAGSVRVAESLGLFTDEPWVQHILDHHYLQVSAIESVFPRFAASYHELTGESLTPESSGVLIRKNSIWKAYSLKVYVERPGPPNVPDRYRFTDSETSDHLCRSDNALCWELIRLGARIGRKKANKGESQ